MDGKRPTFALETFWEACDRESIADHPLERELTFRLDSLERYRAQIEVADEIGDDEAVDVLSRYYDSTSVLINRLRDALQHQGLKGRRPSPDAM
jgi:hypothetical protein